MQWSLRQKWVIGIFFAIAVYFPVFLHLDGPPVKIWDESLFAMRAYHMAETGTYLPNFERFPGISYYRNLKPPFGTFFQAAFFRLFGVSELTLRLPVALFVLATLGLLCFFSKRLSGNLQAGILASLVLLTSSGYVRPHVSRTGDHDAILAFWLLLSLFFLYRWSLSRKSSWIWALAGCLFIAFLTKSIVAFFFVPGYLIYLLWQKQFVPILRMGTTYLAAGALALGIVAYYLLMEWQMPGFFAAVNETVFGRYVAERNNLGAPFSHYFETILSQKFWPWVLLLSLNIWQLFQKSNLEFKRISQLLWSCVLCYLLIISFSETKLSWYDAAVFPPLALLAGVSLHRVLNYASKLTQWPKLIYAAAVVLIFAWPYYKTINSIYHQEWDNPAEWHAYLMRQQQKQDYIVYCGGYNGQVGFYTEWYNQHRDGNIRVSTYWNEVPLNPGNQVLVCQDDKRQQLQQHFETQSLSEYRTCQMLLLLAEK